MADINGTNVVAPVVPFTTEDSYPTHLAQYGKGGWRSVQTKAELATIPSQRLEVGMVAYVIEESTPYVYDGSDWKALVIEMDLSKVATEATLIAGIASIEEKIENKSVDLTSVAKEETLKSESQTIQSAIQNIDLSSVESKVDAVGAKIDNISLPEIDTTELAKEATLNNVSSKIDNINVDVDLSSVAKQGTNDNATNTAILDAVGNIKLDKSDLAKEATLEEVKAELQKVSSLDADILQGKIKIANAISHKGVPSVYTDSLNDMANKVNQIPQELNLGASGFEQMVVPSPDMWNIYTVAQDLMKIQTERADYLPAYMEEYIKGYGANVFCVAEYQVLDEIELQGADGYLTSDGHFYVIVNGLVTHTLPSGVVETIETNTYVHTFYRERLNVWVAYLHIENGYTFETGTIICPNRLAICGICASVSINGTNNMQDIWVIGEVESIKAGSATGGSWTSNQVIRNYKNHNSGVIYVSKQAVNSISMPELEYISSRLWTTPTTDNTSYDPYYLHLPNLKAITKVCLFQAGTGYRMGMNRLKEINLPSLEYINVPLCTSVSQPNTVFENLTQILLPSLEEINITSSGGSTMNANANGLIVSNTTINNTDYKKLKKIYIPKLRKTNKPIVYCGASGRQYYSLIDIEVGELEQSLSFSNWTPVNVLADAELTTQLDKNIREHIGMKVQDRTDNTALTITFHKDVRNILTEETEAVFAAKNWNISPAKSV